MSQRLNNLNEIIGVLRSGADQYRKAARKVSKDKLEETFVAHAEEREKVAGELADIVDTAGGDPATASPTEKGRELLTSVGSLFNDTDDTLVAALEEHEDRTLAAYRNAIQHRDNETDKAMLEAQFDTFRRTHDTMRNLKKAA